MINVKYSSNNSGGSWWLSDNDWHKLEAAGWKVNWAKDRKDSFMHEEGQERWLGALATSAEKSFETPADAIREFETVTGQHAGAGGCNCCGAPHSFEWTDSRGKWDYVSGESCLGLLYGND